MDLIFYGKVENGKIIHTDKKSLNDYISTLNGNVVDIIIRKHKKDRTNPQNRYMWGCVYKLISDHTGYTSDEVHNAMRMMFLLDRSRDIPTLRSTTKLSTVEMEEYLEKIRQWASIDLQCVIPLPNEIEL